MAAVGYLDRYFEPVTAALTPELARTLADLQPSADVKERVAELGQKADAGSLTKEERAEYKDYVDAGDIIALLKAKARRYLAIHAS